MKRMVLGCTAAALSACASAPPRDPTLGREWTLVGDGEVRPTIFLDENRAAGVSGSNPFFATAVRENGGVALTSIGTTRMYCEGRMESEQDYITRLGQVAGARRDEEEEDELLLLDGHGQELLRYRRE